ncbi:MAG TPA: hypothetical protein VGX23_37100 [Actinocrinis sp.]|nr:hypothetical protein [Actinocrinis sp.]
MSRRRTGPKARREPNAETVTLEKVRLEEPPDEAEEEAGAEVEAQADLEPDAGPEPEPGEDPTPEAESEARPSDHEDDSGLMDALRQLKVRRDRTRDLTIGIGCGVVGLIIGLLVGHVTASPSSSPAPLSPDAAASRGALSGLAPQTADAPGRSSSPSAGATTDSSTVTFTVTGSAPGGVLINYGTNSTGAQSTKLPFSASEPFDGSGNILYYDVYAQLHGSGSLSCSISVNGKVVKSGTATTESDICSAQIAPSAVTGQ